MPRYVALLRSVNVAGHGRLAMNELRASFEGLGYDDVTHVHPDGQRAVLHRVEERGQPRGRHRAAARGGLRRRAGRDPAHGPRAAAHREGEPLRQGGGEPVPPPRDVPRHRPAEEGAGGADLPPSGRDELVVDGREVYVHTPDGYAGTKYTGTFLERRLGVVSTTRNWNTVTKLCELAGR